jgi:hypothetical protein
MSRCAPHFSLMQRCEYITTHCYLCNTTCNRQPPQILNRFLTHGVPVAASMVAFTLLILLTASMSSLPNAKLVRPVKFLPSSGSFYFPIAAFDLGPKSACPLGLRIECKLEVYVSQSSHFTTTNKCTSKDKYRSNRGVNFPNKKNPSRSEGTGVNLALFGSIVSHFRNSSCVVRFQKLCTM